MLSSRKSFVRELASVNIFFICLFLMRLKLCVCVVFFLFDFNDPVCLIKEFVIGCAIEFFQYKFFSEPPRNLNDLPYDFCYNGGAEREAWGNLWLLKIVKCTHRKVTTTVSTFRIGNESVKGLIKRKSTMWNFCKFFFLFLVRPAFPE